MKKPTEKQRKWHKLHTKKLERRRSKNDDRIKIRKSKNLEVPEILNLEDEFSDTIKFVNQIRNTALRKKQRVKLSFRKTDKISAGAGLILAAEMARCLRLKGYSKHSILHGTYPNSKIVEKFLQELGFFKTLRIKERKIDIKGGDYNKDFIKIMSGNEDLGKDIKTLKREVFDKTVEFEESITKSLYRGLVEAMNNVTSHAYIDELDNKYPPLEKRWWMGGYWNRDESTIMVMMYDQGVGIPATLRHNHPKVWRNLLAMLGLGENDGAMIQAAMELGKTGTAEPQRGKGMADLKELIDRAGSGHLKILSRRGKYLYSIQNGRPDEKSEELSRSLHATYIEWSISKSEAVRWVS